MSEETQIPGTNIPVQNTGDASGASEMKYGDKAPDDHMDRRQSCSSVACGETHTNDEISSESLLKRNAEDNCKSIEKCQTQEFPKSVVKHCSRLKTAWVLNDETGSKQEMDPASGLVIKDMPVYKAKQSTSREKKGHLELLPYDILHDNSDKMGVVDAHALSPMATGTVDVRAVINNQGTDLSLWRARAHNRLPAQCTVVENSENVTIGKNVEIHHHEIQESNYKNQITTIIENIQRRHKDLHVTTRGLKEAKYILEDRNWVVIAGNPGDGKTWMGHQLLLEHRSTGYEPLVVTSTDDWKKLVGGKKSRKQIVFIDDIFGPVNLDYRKVSDWMSLLENIEALLKERKGELLVVCTTRKIIWAEVCSELTKYKSFEAMRLLDLSLYRLNKKEKMELLSSYGSHFEIDMNSDFLDHQTQPTHGFPHCVEMYCTNKHLRKQGEQQFFSRPLEFLKKDINNLYKYHSNKFCALVILLITKNNDRNFCIYGSQEELDPVITKASRCCLLNQIPSFGVIKDSMQQLNGVYVEQDESGNVKLKHSSFSEIISLLIIQEHPLYALDILDLELLVRKTTCYNHTNSPKEYVVKLQSVCFEKLAKRLTYEMMANCNALKHDAFTNSEFVNIWLKYATGTIFEGTLTLMEHLITVNYVTSIEWFFHRQRQYSYFLCKVPVSAMGILFPAVIQCETLKKYWKTDEGKEQISSALALATFMNCSTSVVETLLDAGANIDSVIHAPFRNIANALCNAIVSRNIANIKLLLSRGACPFASFSVYEHSGNILCLAYASEDKHIVKLISEYIVMHETRLPDISKGRPFVQHCLYGENYLKILHSLAAEYLQTYRTRQDNAMFYESSDNVAIGNVVKYIDNAIEGELVSNILERRICNEGLFKTDILQAHTDWFESFMNRPYESLSCLKRLIEKGFDINSKHAETGRTVLHILVLELLNENSTVEGIHGSIEHVLDVGANANVADERGNVPLFDALRYSLDLRVLKLLVQNTNVATIKNKKGLNAFHFLFLARNIAPSIIFQLTELLLKAGCNINQADHQSRAPIALAPYTHIKLFLKHRTRFGINGSAVPDLPLRLIMLNTKDILTYLSVLVDIGFTHTAEDKRKRNIVHIVAMSGYESLTKIKILRDIFKVREDDVNATDIHGITPLMLACKKKPTDEQFISFLLETGARIEDEDKRGYTSLHYCIEKGVELKLFLGREITISDEIIEYAILNVRGVDQLVNFVKVGKIGVENALHLLEETKCKPHFIDKGDALFALLMAFGNTSEIINRSGRARRLILKTVSCLTHLLQDGVDVHVLTDKGIPLSWLPPEDRDASSLIEVLAQYGVDIDNVFTPAENIACIPAYLAKHGYIKTLMNVLKNRKSRFDILNEQSAKVMLLNLLSSSEDDISTSQVLDHILHSDTIQKCILELAPSYINCCVDRVPFKIQCARLLCSRFEHAIFEVAENRGLLHTAVKSLGIPVSIAKINDASGNFKEEEESYSDNNLLTLIHILQNTNLPIYIQDDDGRTPLMAILLLPNADSLQKSVHELINQAHGFPEIDVQQRNILHYLTMSKLSASFRHLMIQLVLRKGAIIQPDCFGRRAVYYLPSVEWMSFLEILKSDANKKLCIDMLLYILNANVGDNAMSEMLITATKLISSDVNDITDITGVTLLAQASRALNVTLMRYLLDQEADTNKPDLIGQTSLHKLFSSETLLSLSWLKRYIFGPNSNQRNVGIAMLTISRISFNEEYLCEFETENDLPFFHRSILRAVNDALHILFRLLEAGADPNKLDYSGRSPLHHCVGAHIPDAFVCPAIQMLLAYGADVNMEDVDGITPLMVCAQYVHTKYRRMNILITAGANVAATDHLQNGLPYYSNLGIKTRVALNYMFHNDTCLTV